MNMGIVAGLIKALAPGVDPQVIEQAVTDWLDEHPEATTTVQDGSITEAKLAQDVLAELGEIEELKEAITELEGSVKYASGQTAIAYDGTYDGDGQCYDYAATADITQHTANTDWRHAIVECQPFDMFIVNVNGGGNGRAWGFISEAGVVLSRSAENINCRDTIIYAPANTKYLILNDKKSGLTSYKSAYKYYPGSITELQSSLSKLIDDQYKKETVQYSSTNGYIDTSSTSVTNIYTPNSSNNWRFATIPCNEGDIFIINSIANTEAKKRPFAFVANDGSFVSKCTDVDQCVNMIVIAPTNAAYLIINDMKCGVDSYCLRKEMTVIEKNEQALDDALLIGANEGTYTTENSPDSFVLLHFSDIHGSAKNMQNVCRVKEHLASVLDDTICTGDITENYFADSMNFWSKCTDGTILTCIGNHDVKISGTTGYIESQPTEAELYAKFMQNYISKWGTVEHSSNNLYYYKDYADKNIRLIVLNLLYPSSEKTTEQNTWLASALAGAKSEGYGVVIAQHYYPVSGTKINCTFSAEVNFPTQMYNPQNYMYNGDALTTYQATVQDFIDGGGNFACWLAGHKHADYIAYHPTYPKQVFIGVGCETAFWESTIADARRVAGTRSFDCMNVMAVDPEDKKIKIIRIGSDRDFLGRHRGALTLDYSTSPATVVYND